MRTKRFLLLLLLTIAAPALLTVQAQIATLAELTDDGFNFLIGTDLGRVGYYDQTKIGHTMGEVADNCDAEFILAQGDTFHYMGVESVHDPLFRSNFEDVYSHPELQIPWYPVLGNHEYQGNTQAVIDYSNISRRWQMPARYYVKHIDVEDTDMTLDIFFIDTTPLIDKYRINPKYTDAGEQSREEQLTWLENELSKSTADFKIVVGHHPIYADTSKDDIERAQMQEFIDPLVRKYGVDLYTAGHIHNHQHIRVPNSEVDYLVVSSGSKSRKVKYLEHTVFASPETGFAFVSIKDNTMTVYLLDSEANILHSFSRPR